ncbi:hypothetical protein [Nocardioides limicola]|uniref:hypothetical protein n=1 Tax=Nocardioides limicola TaxID=2803368 RepID=UPI00193B819B|nr:hypothetical protein [Nocardioides sp. DJM-14]
MRKLATSLVLALGLSLIPVSAAHAADYTVRDARGDVVTFDMETGEETLSSVANGDIVRTRFVHSNKAVVVRVKFRSLAKQGLFRGDYVRVVTDAGLRRDVHVSAMSGQWKGDAEMTRPNHKPVDCDLSHRIDYGKNLLTLRIPRACLNNPRWVRVGVASFWLKGDLSAMYADDAQKDGKVGNRVALSPRIRRG